ncbi:MAG: hypothetical protein HYS60_01155 [Candidatus Wildermuthbacteria bacterium]|nr:hypothetical protein [Candidatus Wildermuthbacteria bacterium]
MKKYFLALLTLAGSLLPSIGWALTLNLKYPTFGGIDLKNLPVGKELPALIGWLYTGIVALSGLAAFLMIVWGGIAWMTSSGNPSRISDAQDRIQKALLGLLLVLASFLILQIINPDLVLAPNF